jgi:hypothetical protein
MACGIAASERPEYFASYEETPPVMAYLQQTSVLSERIFSVSLSHILDSSCS